MSSKPRILFLSHAASRNGATILLLHMLRWLKGRTNYQFEVLVNGRGELLEEFQALCPTMVWRNPSFLLDSMPGSWRKNLKPRLEAKLFRGLLRGRHYDVAHVNTVAMWPHVPVLASRARSLLWHVHELEYAIKIAMPDEAWRRTFPLADRFVAVSQSVKDTLINKFDVPAEKVDLVHGFIPTPKLSPEEYRLKRQTIRAELGWTENMFVVGGCGTLGWRKGTDIFLQVARVIRQKGRENVRFLWVGGGAKGEEALEFGHDIRAMGLEDICRWVPNTTKVSDYYHAMDVFALTSREDPFPLVMLEAGTAELPVVCFANSGGGPEFVGQNAGLVAPYLDVESFAAHLLSLQDDRDLRRRLGAEAARRVQANHTVEKQAAKLLESIERCLKK